MARKPAGCGGNCNGFTLGPSVRPVPIAGYETKSTDDPLSACNRHLACHQSCHPSSLILSSMLGNAVRRGQEEGTSVTVPLKTGRPPTHGPRGCRAEVFGVLTNAPSVATPFVFVLSILAHLRVIVSGALVPVGFGILHFVPQGALSSVPMLPHGFGRLRIISNTFFIAEPSGAIVPECRNAWMPEHPKASATRAGVRESTHKRGMVAIPTQIPPLPREADETKAPNKSNLPQASL